MTDLEASAEAIAEAVAETLETQPQPEISREQENAQEAQAIVDAARKPRKKRESKKLSKAQRNACRLIRGASSATVTFNGIPVKIARSSALNLVELGKAKIKATMSDDDELFVSLEAI